VRTLDGASADQSNADFTIALSRTLSTTTLGSSAASGSSTAPGPGTVRVTAPNGGETTWGAGGRLDVQWQTTYGSTQYYDVSYSADGGASWRRVAEAQGTLASFVVPTTPTSRALINVTAHNGTGDTSDATFGVVSKLTVTSPNGGETLTGGTVADITWTTFGLTTTTANPTAEVSYDSGTTWIQTPTVSAGSRDLRWMVSGPAATHARIRVRTSDANGQVTDESDADFTIAP
jgi:hypothetical protein